ncbi:MAG: hypothetical protein D6732_29580 [Methanobacteriota archaeon]|nr:MAG: hypothetical protein D6732_29580 [Euryarchaeota archaeon]
MVKGSNDNFLTFYDSKIVSELNGEEKYNIFVSKKFVEDRIVEIDYKPQEEKLILQKNPIQYTSYIKKIIVDE